MKFYEGIDKQVDMHLMSNLDYFKLFIIFYWLCVSHTIG